jgi:hypothetical protein
MDEPSVSPHRVTQLLEQWSYGDDAALAELTPLGGPSASARPTVVPYHNWKLASCFASSQVTICESLVTIPISATESGEALESGVASVSN